MITLNIIHFLSTFWMMAVIWFVQIVHYPLFKLVPYNERVMYAQKHQQWISWIVMPAMLIECLSLFFLKTYYLYDPTWILSVLCLVIIWASTFFLQVPCHQKLISDPKDPIIKKLVNTNWIRTVFWTIKSILAYQLLSFEINYFL